MKRVLSVILLFCMALSSLTFTSCDSFIGGEDGFGKTGDFYKTLINTLSSVVMRDNTYIDFLPLKENSTTSISAEIDIKNYSYNGIKPTNDSFNMKLNLSADSKNAISYGMAVDGFGYAYEENYTFDGYETLISFGELVDKPYYFNSNEQSIVEEVINEIENIIKNAKYTNSEEIYKINGKSVKADVVEFSLNSDAVTSLLNNVSNLFDVNANNFLQELYYDIYDFSSYFIAEKIHISWCRYFSDGNMCRERIKFYDNYSHYIELDVAISTEDNTALEISAKGYNGSTHFSIFNMSVMLSKITNGKRQATAEAMIGDEIYISTSNEIDCNNKTSKGSGEVRMIASAGEISIPFSFSSCTENGYNVLNLSCQSLLITFSATIKIKLNINDGLIDINAPKDYYALNNVEDMYEYIYTFLPTKEAYDENIKLCFEGEVPKDIVRPFELDITYDDGISNDTDGVYGKPYVEILMSDTYTYIFEFPSSETDHRMATCKQYKANGKEMYDYLYANGDTYRMWLAPPTKYEVQHGVEKIIMTEYSEEEYNQYYPKQEYLYNTGGICEYDGRMLVYEKYFDYDSNIYTFIFNEDGTPEIMVITYSETGETLYTFVKEISGDVPESVFVMPPYEFVSSSDYYD